MILSIDTEKVPNKIQHPFMINTLRKTGTDGSFLNFIKSIYKKHIANTTLNGDRLNAFSLWSETRQVCLFSLLLSDTVLEVLARVIRQEKETKRHIDGKRKNKTVPTCI